MLEAASEGVIKSQGLVPEAEVVVVGAGLAGACLAWSLQGAYQVVLVEQAHPASGASGAAAGLVNPFMGQKAKPVWRKAEALHAFKNILEACEKGVLLGEPGVLRPATTNAQAVVFQEAARTYPASLAYLTSQEVEANWPVVSAPWGGLWVVEGCAVAVPQFVQQIVGDSQKRGAMYLEGYQAVGWDEAGSSVQLFLKTTTGKTEMMRAKVLVWANGAAFLQMWQPRPALALHPVKGQTATVASAKKHLEKIPHLAGGKYVVNTGKAWVIGSTYEHTFANSQPTDEASRQLLAETQAMLPPLKASRIIGAQAGVRVNVPGTRLPMVGLLPGFRHTWLVNGLGSKGLLMAPWIAQAFPDYLRDPAQIPAELRVR